MSTVTSKDRKIRAGDTFRENNSRVVRTIFHIDDNNIWYGLMRDGRLIDIGEGEFVYSMNKRNHSTVDECLWYFGKLVESYNPLLDGAEWENI